MIARMLVALLLTGSIAGAGEVAVKLTVSEEDEAALAAAVKRENAEACSSVGLPPGCTNDDAQKAAPDALPPTHGPVTIYATVDEWAAAKLAAIVEGVCEAEPVVKVEKEIGPAYRAASKDVRKKVDDLLLAASAAEAEAVK